MEISICIALAIASILLSGIAILLACVCWSVVVGLKNSTHQIQMVPMENEKGDPIEGEHLDKNMEQALSQEYQVDRDYL